MTVTDPELRRAPGRPRSVEADQAILDAAIEEFADAGYEGLTIEAVAARAGVSKATVYRRYPGKLDLVVAACKACSRIGEQPPDTGTTEGDLRDIVNGLRSTLTDTPFGRAMPVLIGDRARVPELDTEHRAVVREKRARIRVVVERAIANGGIRPDADPELVADACIAPVFYRFLVTHAPLDDDFAEALVESVLRAFAPAPAP